MQAPSDDTPTQQFEAVADQYRAFRDAGRTANDLVEIPAALELIGPVERQVVVDAGCAFGFYAKELARRGAGRVIAVDISRRQIELAREYCTEHADVVEFVVGDVTETGVLPESLAGSVDLVTSNVAVHFNLERFFSGMARLLKPTGRLVYSQVHPAFSGLPEGSCGPDYDYFRTARRVMNSPNLFGNEMSDDYDWLWNHYTVEDVSRAAEAAGLLIRRLREPAPTTQGGAEVWSRVPVFLLVELVPAE